MLSSEADRLSDLVARVARQLGATLIAAVCDRLEVRQAYAEILESVSPIGARLMLKELFDAWGGSNNPAALASALRAAQASDRWWNRQSLDLVWTGPAPAGSSFRSTDQALLEIIDGAQEDLLIVSFAAYRMPVLLAAIERAMDRGVRTAFVLESAAESDGRISVDPIHALSSRMRDECAIYCWPKEQRPVRMTDRGALSGVLHAKCAVADAQALLVSSANITEGALWLNLELGVLLRGGELPGRVRRHFQELVVAGTLRLVHGKE